LLLANTNFDWCQGPLGRSFASIFSKDSNIVSRT